jgi:hypothetical protein
MSPTITTDRTEGVYARLGNHFSGASLPIDHNKPSRLSITGAWGEFGEEAIVEAVVYLRRPQGKENRADFRVTKETAVVTLPRDASQIRLSMFRKGGERVDLLATVEVCDDTAGR